MPDFDSSVPMATGSTSTPSAPQPTTSLLARLLNIFAIPGQVFEEVRQSRHKIGNWAVPALLCGLALGAAAMVAMAQPQGWKKYSEQYEKLRAAQAETMAAAVKSGQMTRADADKALAMFAPLGRPAVVRWLAAAAGFCGGVAGIFWWAFIVWLLARTFLRSPAPFGKALEVAGLASMVGLLNTAGGLALSVKLGALVSGSGFVLSVPDLNAPGQQLLAWALSLLDFWFIAVLGVGLGRLTGAAWMRCVLLLFACWMAGGVLGALIGLPTAS
jgi:hypothetical protein